MPRSQVLLFPALIGLALASAEFRPGAVAADPPTKEQPPVVIDAATYPTLQAAFDAVPKTGGLVKLPPGDFRLHKPLVLARNNTRVVGAGAATHLINCNQKGQSALIVRPADLDKNPKARLWQVHLANFRVSGDAIKNDPKSDNHKNAVAKGAHAPIPEGADAKPKSGDGIVLINVDELYLHGLAVDHCGRFGIHLIDCYEDPRIADSIVTYCAEAGINIVAAHDIVVSANHFEENGDALRCLNSYNLCMNGNNLDDHKGNGVVIENTYGSVLSGNMIEECDGAGIILDRDCYGITLSANVIADNFGGGIDLRDAWGCAVSANTFTINAVRALTIGPKSGRITVTGNNFSDSYIGGKGRRAGKPNLATGILLKGATDVAISGNVFSGLAGHAVETDGLCARVLFHGNILTDMTPEAKKRLPPLNIAKQEEVILGENSIDAGPGPKRGK